MPSRRNCCCSIFERLWKFFWQPSTSKRLNKARQRDSQQTELRSLDALLNWDVLLSCDDRFSLTVDCKYVDVQQILKSDSVSSKLKAILLSDTCGVFKSNSVVNIMSKYTLLLLAVGYPYVLVTTLAYVRRLLSFVEWSDSQEDIKRCLVCDTWVDITWQSFTYDVNERLVSDVAWET